MTRRKEWLVASLLLLLFSGISLATIGHFSPWHDESYTATLIQGSYSDIVHRTMLDVHPPLFYVVLKTWSLVVGNSVVMLRLFSFVCMLGAITVAWRSLRRMFGSSSALWGLAAMSVGAFIIRYSQEMRMYGMGALLAMSLTYLLWRLTNEDLSKKRARWFSLSYAVLAVCAVYTHYFLSFLLVGHAVYTIFRKFEWKRWWCLPKSLGVSWYIMFGLPLLAFVPWLHTAADQFRATHNGFWIPPFDLQQVSSTMSNYLFFRQGWELTGWAVAFGLAAIIAAGWLYTKWYSAPLTPPQRAARRLLTLSVVVPAFILILVSLPPFKPSYQDRYLSFYSPLLYGSLGIAMAHTFRNGRYWLERTLLPLFMAAVLLTGTIYASKLGDSAGWRPQPHFTINQLNDFINSKSPHTEVVSTTLWTFFDEHVTMGRYNTVLLYTPTPIGKYGNGSAVYNRYDLQIKTLPETVPSGKIWMLEESGLPLVKVPANWVAQTALKAGYAQVILYKTN